MALGSKLPLAARENEGYYSFPRKKKKHYPQRDLCRRTYLILHVKHFIHRLLYKVKGKWDSALEKLWFLGKTDLRKWSGPEDGHEWKYWANCSGRRKKKKASKSCNLIKNFNPSSEHSYLVLNLLEGICTASLFLSKRHCDTDSNTTLCHPIRFLCFFRRWWRSVRAVKKRNESGFTLQKT